MSDDDIQQRTHDLVTRIDERLASHVDRFEEHMEIEERRFDKVETTLYGNGQPGLTTQVSLLEEGASRHRWLMRALVSSTLSLIVAVVVYLLS